MTPAARINNKPAEIAAVHLRHPLLPNCPATAAVVDWYRINGRNAGLILAFPDGHRAALTYDEIAALQEDEDEHE
jgi:hypothetical protein